VRCLGALLKKIFIATIAFGCPILRFEVSILNLTKCMQAVSWRCLLSRSTSKPCLTACSHGIFFPGRGNAHAHEVDEDHLFFKHNLFRTLGINSFRTPAKLQTRIESEFWAHVLGKIRAHVKRD
jgi:hypothetical protein